MNDLKTLIEKRRSLIFELTNNQNTNVLLDRSKVLEQWKNYCTYCPPNTFLIMYNLKQQEIVHTHGIEKLDYAINTKVDLLQHTHENHKLFYANHILILELLSHRYGSKTDLTQVKSSNIRALKNSNDTYEYVKVTSSPVSLYQNGQIHELISWYTPVTSYHGQPFQSQITANGHPIRKDGIVDSYNLLLHESYDYILFTKRQKEVIALIKKGIDKDGIACQLDLSIRTVEKYKEMILNKGKILIPFNKFRSADDVVFHLSAMGFI